MTTKFNLIDSILYLTRCHKVEGILTNTNKVKREAVLGRHQVDLVKNKSFLDYGISTGSALMPATVSFFVLLMGGANFSSSTQWL